MDARTIIDREATGLGFDVVGVTGAAPVADALAALATWCDAGHGADLKYMTRNPPERADPRTLLKSVQTVVTVAVNYYVEAPAFADEGRFGRVARYAWGQDYHDVVIPRLRDLAATLGAEFGGRARAACDYSPILERAFAARAGLGFFGKNTCLLLPRRGSWLFLGEVLLEADLGASDAAPASSQDHCGTCVDCMPACPTKALDTPYVVDSRRCISYLTIEHTGMVPRALRTPMGPWLFGCDDCQDVCPFNRFATETQWSALHPREGVGTRLDVQDLLEIADDDTFEARFAGTPLLRPRRRGLLRNAAIVARNIGAEGAIPALRGRLDDPEPVIRAHALWALAGLAPVEAATHAERLRGDADPAVAGEALAVLEEPA